MLVFGFVAADVPHTLTSPDGKLSLTIQQSPVRYSVEIDNQPLVLPSSLGLTFADGSTVGSDAKLSFKPITRFDKVWRDSLGRESQVRDQWNELSVTAEQAGRRLGIRFRVANNGIGIRYEMPEGGFTIKQDLTTYRFAKGSDAWGGRFHTSAEVQYPKGPIEELPKKPFCLPLLVKAKPAYVAIAESDLLDWSGMFLAKGNEAGEIETKLASDVVGTGPKTSPWRTLLIGRDAASLATTNLIKSLATPSRVSDTSWIKPGACAWDPWWTGSNPTLPQFRGLDARGDTTAEKRFIDFAAEMGWPYQLVDWNWYDMSSPDPDVASKPSPHMDLPGMIAYAKQKGVQLILWIHSKDVHRMGADRLFQVYEKWGVAGVKIDFMDSDTQETVRWYEETLAAAARHHLLVDFHGAYKPTGLARTYPNYITQEGVLGNEYNKIWGEQFNLVHMATLPFTRFLLGPADITPGAFLNRNPQDFKTNAIPTEAMGTRCRQLALCTIPDSPLLVLCDDPQNYRGKPGIEYLRGLPTVWDETRVLQAEVGELFVVARRKGAKWWIAAINGTSEREVTIPLSFLSGNAAKLELFEDGSQPEDVHNRHLSVESKGFLTVKLAAGGGFVARTLSK